MKRNFMLLLAAWMLSMSAMAATVSVNPGDGTLKTAITSASSGDVLVLSDGSYGVSSNIDIATDDKVITIQAASGTHPMIAITNGSIRLRAAGVQLTMKGVTVDGNGDQVAIKPYPSSGTIANVALTLINCTFKNMARGIYVYANVDNMSLMIDSCIFRDMLRAVYVLEARRTCQNVHITNSTFMHVGDADNRTLYFAPVDGEDDIQYDVTCEIDHCTFYDCNNTRTVYCPAYNGSHVTNCIGCNTVETDGYYVYAVYGANSYVHNSIAYKSGIKTSSSATNANCIFQDPMFVDAANDNLQLYNNSPAIGAGTDGSNLGDPRWGVSQESADISNTPIADRMVKYPYSMAPTTSSVRILWQQSDSLSLGTVVYGIDGEHFNDTVRGHGGKMVAGEGYVHVVELTGLQPFTRYYFKVGDKKQILDYVASTMTAPMPGTPYRIFTISDIHVNSCNNWSNMQDSICALGANLMMCNGDFVNDGSGRDWNTALFNPGRKFLSQVPMMSSAGNHETGDPLTYRWSTFFDYFWQFNHGAEEDSIKDPRGEGYFGYDYGNARILAVNVSDEPASPLFDKNSNQFKWLENELKNATKDWILIFGHVGLTTSGYHGQWPPEYRDDWRALLEKYAQTGKKIIYFCGDDHSFEHAYKDGVHYVRPACGRNSNYAQCNTSDIQYSMFYRQISCYSTLDMAADGSSLHLIARDSASNVFYEYTFYKNGEEISPSLTFTSPTKQVEVDDSIQIKWFVFDPNKDALVNLYVSTTPNLQSVSGLTPILQNADTKTKKFFWHTRDIYPKGAYYLYATLASGGKSYLVAKPEAIMLVEDTIAPHTVRYFWGFTHGNNYRLSWQNPTHEVDYEITLQDFNTDLSHIQEDSETGCSSILSNPSGILKVVYATAGDWSQTSADYVFDTITDCHETPTLSFRLKGDGSSTCLRIICKNMVDDQEDWWYTEEVNLSSTSWKLKTVDLSSMSAFDWHTNADSRNRCEGVVRICFAITTSAAVSGNYCIEDLKLAGHSSPALDYVKTTIRRSQTAYPEIVTDGDAVYAGTDEGCIDTQATAGQVYYYSAFTEDDRGNVSKPVYWLSTDVHDGLSSISVDQPTVTKWIQDGRLLIRNQSTIYTAQGQPLHSL